MKAHGQHTVPAAPAARAMRYERAGILAIDPRAFLEFFFLPPTPPENETIGDVEVVSISGPLEQYDEGWCDSYEAIRRRVAKACEGSAEHVLLRIDSPGGDAAGCFEAARFIKDQCAQADKTLLAYVDGKACSAAYALASVASHISASDTAIVGSIGVITRRLDFSAQNAARGVRVEFVTSGARKADGNPDSPLSDAELKSTQEIIDSMAGVFFDLVGEMRGTSPQTVKALEADIFHGPSAILAGLVDAIEPFEALLANAGERKRAMLKPQTSKYEEGRAALEEAAKGEGDEAEAAKRALAAMDAPPADAATEEETPADEEVPAEEDKEEAAAAAGGVSATTAGKLGATVSSQGKRLAAVEKELEAERRTNFLASRPDLDPALVKVLAKQPLAEVRAIVNAIKKPSKPNPAATAVVPATQGAGQSTGPRLAPTAKQELDIRMGLVAQKPGVKAEPHKLTLGAPTPVLPTPAAS